MLREISAVEGSILDDDRVVEGMERLVRIVLSFFVVSFSS